MDGPGGVSSALRQSCEKAGAAPDANRAHMPIRRIGGFGLFRRQPRWTFSEFNGVSPIRESGFRGDHKDFGNSPYLVGGSFQSQTPSKPFTTFP